MIMLRKMVGNFSLVPLWRPQMRVCQRVSFKIVAANDQSLKYGQCTVGNQADASRMFSCAFCSLSRWTLDVP